jgi:hypothetical protein
MTIQLGPLTLPWGRDTHKDDPYWDRFVNGPVFDQRNLLSEAVNKTTGGVVNPIKADIHSPEITAEHIKELAIFVGADSVGIVKLTGQSGDDGEDYPFGIVCSVKAEYDPRVSKGAGGQVPVQDAQFVTFILAAYIREMGYRAVTAKVENPERFAVEAGLGTLDSQGRLVIPGSGSRVYVGDLVYTELPLVPDRA